MNECPRFSETCDEVIQATRDTLPPLPNEAMLQAGGLTYIEERIIEEGSRSCAHALCQSNFVAFLAAARSEPTGNARTTRCALKRGQVVFIRRRRFHSTHLNSFEKVISIQLI
jgi:hypothetical protein